MRQKISSLVQKFAKILRGLVLEHFSWEGDHIEITFLGATPHGEKRIEAISKEETFKVAGKHYRRLGGRKLNLSLLPSAYKEAYVISCTNEEGTQFAPYLHEDGAHYDVSIKVLRRGLRWQRAEKLRQAAEASKDSVTPKQQLCSS